MTKTSSITVDLLRQVLDYDPNLGVLTWKSRPASLFSCKSRSAEWSENAWNAKYANQHAFTAIKSFDGGALYHVGAVNSVTLRANRVCWAIENGIWPSGHIDHIDGNTLDDRIENLRDVTNLENHRNAKMAKSNTSGFNGVTFCKQTGKWRAVVRVKFKTLCLGRYNKIEDAIAARIAANVRFGFSDRHGKSLE